MAELSYLVMTAADCHAYNQKHPHDIVSLNQMLEVRAQEQGETICVGFTTKSPGGFGCETLTFSQLFAEVCKVAYYLQHQSGHEIHARPAGDTSKKPIALLAPSCRVFLVNVFALFRLGYSVLLIAPQNTPEDIAHLCTTVGAAQLMYHESMSKAATAASAIPDTRLDLVKLVQSDDIANVNAEQAEQCRSGLSPEEESETECIIFHSSGSSGKPKPIPQKHRTWTKAACCKPYSPSCTTTPLFHGGISDLLRAMMSCSTLYMYPSTLPITSDNLLQAFKATPTAITSFLSVPYILEMLAETTEGMKVLAGFDLVSTGGSPLPTATGDRFCREGVNLVSRYGSSECGFLMTSFRDFEKDKDWSYLRPAGGKDWLTFEDQGDDTHELIVPPPWPTRSKANREDGSFATSDLFRKHPSISNAWLLTGRSDDVLLLVNGEKASPAPLEAIIKASASVTDALVFGSNRSTLGVAIIPASQTKSKEDLLQAILDANKIAPAHAQIAPELLVMLSSDASFPRASKGSLQRGRAYEAFATEIDNAYKAFDSAASGVPGQKRRIRGAELLRYITDIVKQTLSIDSIEADDDLFTNGLNSLQSVRIRNTLQNTLDLGQARLPMNIVFECATVQRLAEHIDNIGSGTSSEGIDRDLQLMRELAQRAELVTFFAPRRTQALPNGAHGNSGITCVLTGATGSLGAQLIPQLLERQDVTEVVCLCRAENDQSARERVLQNLDKQRIQLEIDAESRLRCLSSSFDKPRLGLSDEVYAKLAALHLLVIHAAWPVHFGASLHSFIPHLQGLHNLIELVSQSDPASKFFFCSSTASVLGASSRNVPERLSTKAEDAVSMGYARSKHVAESICQAAWKQQLNGRIGILRLGQLCGDTKEGIWKPEEGWPLLVSSVSCVGCLPGLKETLSWLPLDNAAQATCDIALDDQSLSTEEDIVPVFHVVSTSSAKTFQDVLKAVKAADISFETVSTTEWLARLQKARESGSEHPCLKMLDLWQKSYGTSMSQSAEPIFETKRVEQYTQALSKPVSQDLMSKMIHYWQDIKLIAATS